MISTQGCVAVVSQYRRNNLIFKKNLDKMEKGISGTGQATGNEKKNLHL